MRIGVDIDGVLTDIESFQMDFCSKYCYENNLGEIINPDAYLSSDIFSYDNLDDANCWLKYNDYYAELCPARFFANEITNKFKKEGNEIYIITARDYTSLENDKGTKARNQVIKWLSDNNIVYDKLLFSGEDKRANCISNGVEIMIEDKPENIDMISKIIPVICYDNNYNRNYEFSNVIRCYSWWDIYYKVNKYKDDIKNGKWN